MPEAAHKVGLVRCCQSSPLCHAQHMLALGLTVHTAWGKGGWYGTYTTHSTWARPSAAQHRESGVQAVCSTSAQPPVLLAVLDPAPAPWAVHALCCPHILHAQQGTAGPSMHSKAAC